MKCSDCRREASENDYNMNMPVRWIGFLLENLLERYAGVIEVGIDINTEKDILICKDCTRRVWRESMTEAGHALLAAREGARYSDAAALRAMRESMKGDDD